MIVLWFGDDLGVDLRTASRHDQAALVLDGGLGHVCVEGEAVGGGATKVANDLDVLPNYHGLVSIGLWRMWSDQSSELSQSVFGLVARSRTALGIF